MSDGGIHSVRELCGDDTIFLTQHLLARMRERAIGYDMIKIAIQSGTIIEAYPTDTPYPSCLILGYTPEPLHIVCSIGSGMLWIITVYRPSPDKWEPGYRKRKR
jgi:hypothetical protein